MCGYPEGANSKPLQHACLENPMNRVAWWATIHGVKKESDTPELLNFLLLLFFSSSRVMETKTKINELV